MAPQSNAVAYGGYGGVNMVSCGVKHARTPTHTHTHSHTLTHTNSLAYTLTLTHSITYIHAHIH